MRTSLYVHVPFCVVKCGYCDFNSFATADTSVHDRFLGALERELELTRVPSQPYTVFAGGGTPSYLDPARFTRFWQILARRVRLDASAETTVECNPESLTIEKARIAYDVGVRRASVGAQSFDPERLRFLDRAHDAGAIRRAVESLRTVGFANVSLDLIFALPGQTLAEWESDLRAALQLEPDHLSCYSLTFEQGTKLGHELAQGHVVPVDEDVDRDMFLFTREFLGQAGFDGYEVSNFAGRGGRSLHNDHYWLQGDYLGVGPGAATHLAGWRGTNLKPVEAWASAIERGFLPTGEAELLPVRRRFAEAMWLGLRRRDGVDLASVQARLGQAPSARLTSEIERAAGENLVVRSGSVVRLTAAGLLVADAVTSRFLIE